MFMVVGFSGGRAGRCASNGSHAFRSTVTLAPFAFISGDAETRQGNLRSTSLSTSVRGRTRRRQAAE